MDFKALSAAIKAAIKNQGLKQKEVAISLGISPNTLSDWVNYGKKPEKNSTMPAYFNLVDKFNINFDDFANHSDLGNRVEYLRFKNKLSVCEFAEKSGVSANAISQIESKRSKHLRGDTAQKLANALGTTVDYILNGLKNETPPPENETVFQKSETVRNGLVMLETRIDELATKKWHSHIAELLLNGIDKSLAYQIHIVSRTNQQIVFGTSNQYILADVNYRNRLIGAIRSRLNDQDLKFEFVPLAEQSQAQAEDSVRKFIEVKTRKIGSEEVNSVSARELYLDLGLNKAHWSRWSKENIEENGYFSENRDFMGFTIMVNGNETRDFAVTIEFAKHIAMMAKTQRAHDYRNYFIECEKQAKSKPRKIDHLSPEVISVLKQARTVQLAMGMGKQQASRYARELVFDRFGIDMELATTGSRNAQLSIVK